MGACTEKAGLPARGLFFQLLYLNIWICEETKTLSVKNNFTFNTSVQKLSIEC